MEQSALRAHSSSVRSGKSRDKVPNESVLKFQPFIREEVLSNIHNVCIKSMIGFLV